MVVQVQIHDIINIHKQNILTRLCWLAVGALRSLLIVIKRKRNSQSKIPSIISRGMGRQGSKQVEIFRNNAIYCLMSRMER